MILRLLFLVACLAATACRVKLEHGEVHSDSATSAGGGYRNTRFGTLSDTIVHFANGDSVELRSSGPLTVPALLLFDDGQWYRLDDSTIVR